MKIKQRTEMRGFTLIELLVVISIIALLLSVLMPALSKARMQAQSVVCQSRMRQLSLALSMYHSENKNRGLESDLTDGYWLMKLGPYLDRDTKGNEDEELQGEFQEIYNCPSTKPPREQDETRGSWGTAEHRWRVVFSPSGVPPYSAEGSYGLNQWVGGWPTTTWVPKPLVERYTYRDSVPGRADIPSFSDCLWQGLIPFDTDVPPNTTDGYEGWGAQNMGLPRVSISRHGDAVNVSFLDNHIERVPLTELWSLKWHKQFKTKDFMPFDGRN